MDMTKQAQVAGTPVCKLIKDYFFAEIAWRPRLAFHIGHMLTALKRQARIYFPDLDELERINLLATFTKEDMQDIFDQQKYNIQFKEEPQCDTAQGDTHHVTQMLK